MSFLQKLCDVYDAVIGTTGAEGEDALLPIGFIRKEIKYDIRLLPSGELDTVQQPKDARTFAVPTTPQAEGRTSTKNEPFPLAEGLQYLIAGKERARFEKYIAQLEAWCNASHAPECLRVVLKYLKRETLYDDMRSALGAKLKYGEGTKNDDAKSIACFSIAYIGEETRLWMREDVRQSWCKQLESLNSAKRDLCYITGRRLPVAENHPTVQKRAKLISAEDDGFPFRYKGRFVDDRSAAIVSSEASAKAHNALKWLMGHQGFRKYGMSIVGWNTRMPELDDEMLEGEKPDADTFEPYVNALFKAISGGDRSLKGYSDPEQLSEEARQRVENIVFVGMQAATKGRMSVNYEQEIPGNVFVEHVHQWHEACRWWMPHENNDRPVTWKEICEAVMGTSAVRTAIDDKQAEKVVTKQMRELQQRLLHCTIDGGTLPSSMVRAAFNRAVRPLSFTNDGVWNEKEWRACVATTCAMIRKLAVDSGDASLPTPALDTACTDRDYLYGRLFAIAHKIEQEASGEGRTNAIRLMTHFVQRPAIAWLELYEKLLPYLKALGAEGKARFYKHRLSQAEGLFRAEDVNEGASLSFRFLIGFSAQTRELWLAKAEKHSLQAPLRDYAPPQTRDELYGCLLAVADSFEWNSEKQETADGKTVSSRDGRTNAMQLTAKFVARPMTTWARIHDKLIAYLEKSGVKAAAEAQRLLCRIEQGFAREERLSDAPLGRGFLHGYLSMLEALSSSGGLNRKAWESAAMPEETPSTRDAAFGMLLALENRMERYALDLETTEEENRPSNAMRFMTRSAERPDEVWNYLEARMRPYQRKNGFSEKIRRRVDALHALIREQNWDNDTPLGPAYLYYFYLNNQSTNGKDE